MKKARPIKIRRGKKSPPPAPKALTIPPSDTPTNVVVAAGPATPSATMENVPPKVAAKKALREKKKRERDETGPRYGSGSSFSSHITHHLDNVDDGQGAIGATLSGVASAIRDKISPENVLKNILGGGDIATSFSKRLFAKKKSSSPDIVPMPDDASPTIVPPMSESSSGSTATRGYTAKTKGIGGSSAELKVHTTLLQSILEQLVQMGSIEKNKQRAGMEDRYEAGLGKTFGSKSPKSITAKKSVEGGGGGLFDNISKMMGDFGGGLAKLIPVVGQLAVGLAALSAAAAAGWLVGGKLKDVIDAVIQKFTGKTTDTLGSKVHDLVNGDNYDPNAPGNDNRNKYGSKFVNQPDYAPGSAPTADGRDVIPNKAAAVIKKANEDAKALRTSDSSSPTTTATTPTIPGASKATEDKTQNGADKYTVGQVPGKDIAAAALQAGVSPSTLAGIVKRESGGKLEVSDGDVGHKQGSSVGITQMSKGALEDVNKKYGTTYTQEQVKQDYKAALQAAAYYLKMRGVAGYNGKGEAAHQYALAVNKTASDIDSGSTKLQVASATPRPVIPEKSTRGNIIAEKSVENKNMMVPVSAPAPTVVSAPSTTINNTTNTHMPMPNVRNDESSFRKSTDRAFS